MILFLQESILSEVEECFALSFTAPHVLCGAVSRHGSTSLLPVGFALGGMLMLALAMIGLTIPAIRNLD